MRLFFFRNNGIVLDSSVCSLKRAIVHQEKRRALMTAYENLKGLRTIS